MSGVNLRKAPKRETDAFKFDTGVEEQFFVAFAHLTEGLGQPLVLDPHSNSLTFNNCKITQRTTVRKSTLAGVHSLATASCSRSSTSKHRRSLHLCSCYLRFSITWPRHGHFLQRRRVLSSHGQVGWAFFSPY